MPRPKFGIEFAMPEYSLPDMIEMAKSVLKDFDFEQIWVTDNIQFRSAFVVLTAMAPVVKCALGTAVTIPYPRNPLDMASSFATLSELVRDRELAIGIGPGGYFYKTIGPRIKPAATVRETIKITRALLKGETVEFKDFPTLSSYFHLKKEAKVKMLFPAPRVLPIYVAVGGPKMLEVAGELGDGVIYNQLTPIGSNFGLEHGLFDVAAKIVEDARKKSGFARKFRRIYLVHISVSDDEEKAKYFAKRNVCYSVAETPDAWLAKIGIDSHQAEAVRTAFRKGLGMDGASKATTDEMIETLAISGTPKQCTEKLARISKRFQGYDQIILDVATVGSEMPKSLKLIAKEILPSLI